MNSIVLSLFPLVALIASGYLFKKYRFLAMSFGLGQRSSITIFYFLLCFLVRYRLQKLTYKA